MAKVANIRKKGVQIKCGNEMMAAVKESFLTRHLRFCVRSCQRALQSMIVFSIHFSLYSFGCAFVFSRHKFFVSKLHHQTTKEKMHFKEHTNMKSVYFTKKHGHYTLCILCVDEFPCFFPSFSLASCFQRHFYVHMQLHITYILCSE